MKKILVVDDEPQIIELIKLRLEANNYEVVSATDGQMAIKVAKDKKPDLIIMDIMMPNLSGGDAVKILRNSESTRSIPIIFLTAIMAGMPNGIENNSINVDGEYFKALSKPFKPDQFMKEVRSALGES